jgi:hypothetical protein
MIPLDHAARPISPPLQNFVESDLSKGGKKSSAAEDDRAQKRSHAYEQYQRSVDPFTEFVK